MNSDGSPRVQVQYFVVESALFIDSDSQNSPAHEAAVGRVDEFIQPKNAIHSQFRNSIRFSQQKGCIQSQSIGVH